MTDRPIIMSAPMIRALLDGRKSQTRRHIRFPKRRMYEHPQLGGWEPTINGGPGVFNIARDGSRLPVPESVGIWHRTSGYCMDAPYQSGDRLWVREAWAPLDALTHNDPGTQALCERGFFRVDGSTVEGEILRWRPSIHMPRWASRLTLTVTDIRAQRLQDISEEDAMAEGMQEPSLRELGGDLAQAAWSDRQIFSRLWNRLHGPAAWDANPWVWAISFETHRCNIDAMPALAAA